MSIIRSFQLLPDRQIKILESLPKHDRSVRVGLIRKKYPEFSREFGQKMKLVMNTFLEENSINRGHIISIKNDAAFIADITPEKTKFWECEFIAKNRYTSYVLLDNKEFYYGNDRIHVKGFGETILKQHEPYMISLIGSILKSAENIKTNQLIDLFSSIQNEYLNFELDLEYYREMNTESLFKLRSEGRMSYGIRDPFEGITDYLDITHNYQYILMMINAML
jgi:hypothetical protein